MKLLRYGPRGQEKPGMMDADGTIRDLSAYVDDINGASISVDGLAKLAAIDPASLPAVDGDPRPLLRDLQEGVPQRMVSTAFETGIGRRWLHHLAALQIQGPTPAAPGLAPGWCPAGPLFSDDPQVVWEATA